MSTLRDIAAAIADELQLDDDELVTISITYKVERTTQSEDDWMDEWYKTFKKTEVVPF